MAVLQNILAVIESWFGIFNVDHYATPQAAIDATGTTGGVVQFKAGKTYALTTILTLPRSITGRLILEGNGATITLSSGAPRFLDFHKIADHDTFQNIALRNFIIDANNISDQSSHVVIGSYGWEAVAGNATRRINIDSITVENVTVINVPFDATGTIKRYAFAFMVAQVAKNEATQNTIRNVFFKNCHVYGSNTAFVVTGNTYGGTSEPGYNIAYDNINITDCSHTPGVSATAFNPSGAIHIGQLAFGGRVRVVNFKGKDAADTGIEINNATNVYVGDAQMDECYGYPYYATNFNWPGTGVQATTQKQTYVYERCYSRRLTTPPDKAAFAMVKAGASYPVPLGHITYRDCDAEAQVLPSTNAVGGYLIGDGCLVDRVTYESCGTSSSGWTYVGVGALSLEPCYFNPDVNTVIEWNGGLVKVNGTRDVAAGAMTLSAFRLRGDSMTLRVRHLVLDLAIANMSAANMRGFALGSSGQVCHLDTALFEGVKVKQLSGDANARVYRFGATATELVIDGRITIRDADHEVLVSGQSDTVFTDNTNKPKVFFEANRFRVFPVAVSGISITASPFVYQNLDNMRQQVFVRGGTVSDIAYSQDGSTYNSTGVLAGPFIVENGDYLRVTYSVVPSAMIKMPLK